MPSAPPALAATAALRWRDIDLAAPTIAIRLSAYGHGMPGGQQRAARRFAALMRESK